MFLFIALAIIAGTSTKLISKYVLHETEPYAFGLFTNFISSIIFLVFALPKFAMPKEPAAWGMLAIASIL